MTTELLSGADPIPRQTVEVGWLIDTQRASVIYSAPRRLGRTPSFSDHAKTIKRCPAINDYEARHFEVLAPFDMALRFKPGTDKTPPVIENAAGGQSAVRGQTLGKMISLVRQNEWRDPTKPVVQLVTPYIFVCDEPCWLNQLPPYLRFAEPQLPGLLLGGRFPIHIWPRPLMWAFEWHDTSKNIVIKRGDPLFYVRFETQDPSRQVRLVEAEMTPSTREYIDSVSEVTNYVNQTFSLFSTAQERRPARLLSPKLRDRPVTSTMVEA